MSELQRLFDAEVEKAKDEIRWRMHLETNELLYGSAYGPWPTPTPTGIATVVAQEAFVW